MHLLLPLHYILAEILLHPHSNWSFLVFSPLWLEHHNSTGGYTSWIGRTRNFVPTCIWTALTTSSFPVYNWDTLPIFWWILLFDSPLIITISPIFTFFILPLWLRLCLSRSATRYSCFHLVFLSIPLNRRLQWNLLFSRLFQESCCLVLIRLTGWSSST